MALCTVSGLLQDATATAISGATVRFNQVAPSFSTTILVPTKEVSTTTASDGTWSLSLIQGLSGIVSIDFPPNATDSNRRVTYSVVIPASASATLQSLATESA